MLVYIILAFIVGVLAFQETGNVTKKNIRNLCFALFVFLMIVALRYWHGDYGTYEMCYYADIDVGGDAGYFQLQQWFHHIGVSFHLFIFILTLFSVFAFKKILSLSYWPLFGMTVLLGKIFTMYAMSGIRQYVAMALCWWALYVLLKNKHRAVFVGMVLMAYTLHASAIVFLPVVFFIDRTYNYKVAILILFLAFLGGKYAMTIFTRASDFSDLVAVRFGNYVRDEEEKSMNLLNYFENFLILVLALVSREKVKNILPHYDFFLYLYIIYCGFLLAGSEIGVVKRLRDYYAIAYVFIVPGTFYMLKNRKVMQSIMIVYFIFLLFRSLIVYDSAFDKGYYGRMIPYHSIFQMK